MWRIWLAALFWGLNWPIVKILLTGTAPWTMRTVGLGLGAALLALATVVSGETLKVPRDYWGRLLIAGLLNVVCFNLCSVFAQMTLPASRAVVLTYTMPLWSVVFARIFLGERIDGLRAVSLTLGGAGIVLLTRPFWPQLVAGELPWGLVYVMAAAITWALGTVYTKHVRIPGSPLALTTWQILMGAVVSSVGLYLFETPRLELWRPEIAITFAYHAVLPQAVSYALWFGLITRVSASTASLGTLLVPIFGVLGAVFLLGERPPLVDIVGFAMILTAVVLDQGVRGWRAPPPAPTPPPSPSPANDAQMTR